MIVNIVDQRDVQRLGGKAARYPASYIVCTLLLDVDAHSVLDVTYGRGRFYYYMKPEFLVGADVKVWGWIVKPDIFIQKPVWALDKILNKINIKFDVLVVDPPAWSKGVSYNKREEYSYILGTPELIINEAIKLAKKHEIPYILLHFNKLLDKLPIIENIEFRYVARYLNNPNFKTTYFTLYKGA